jgi:acetyltransferase-like isoleucine patch superfamily enzyme
MKSDSINIGRYTYGCPRVLWGGMAKLSIGAFCSIGQCVTVYLGGEHHTDWPSTFAFKEKFNGHTVTTRSTKGNVTIGNDVWIGQSATILSGVTIGDGAVIGALAVVAKDVPPYAVAAGNPVRVIRYRFTEDQIARLMKLQWWNWPDKVIQKRMPLFVNNDIEKFLTACEVKA